MKKLAVIIISLALAFGGCSAQTDAEQTLPTQSTQISESTPVETENTQTDSGGITEEQLALFGEAKDYLQDELDSIENMLTLIGQSVGQNPANDEDAYTYMNEELNTKSYFDDIIICDADTNILNVATEFDKTWIGLNLDNIDRMDELFVNNSVFVIKPLASVDDTPFIYCSVPVEGGGWVIAYIDPYSFGATLSSLAIGQDIDFGVMDTTGTNIYSANMTEIGKNVLADDLYANFTELLDLIGNELLPNQQGSGKYQFYASGMGTQIEKDIQWDTVQAFNSELRIYVNSEQGTNTTDDTEGILREFTDEESEWLDSAATFVKDAFSELEQLNESAAEAYVEYGVDSEEFSAALKDISTISGLARNVYFVNSEKYISASYPAFYAQRPLSTYLDTDSEFLDEPFCIPYSGSADHNADCVQAMTFGYPVLQDGETCGWIMNMSGLYEMAAYMTNLQSIGENVNFMLINSDGRIMYDGDIAEVGRNLLTDEIYQSSESLQSFIQDELMQKDEGESEYEFYGAGMTEITQKRIIWETITIFGQDFKISMNSEWK